MAVDPSDILGTPAGYATPAQLAAVRALSQSLMQPEQKTMYSPLQGMSEVAKAVIGGYLGHQMDEREIAKKRAEAETVPNLGLGDTGRSLMNAIDVQPSATAGALMPHAIDQLRKEGVPEANLHAAASHLVGQADMESGLNPSALHDFDANGNPTGLGVYGARGQRAQDMLAWMKENGYPALSAEGQIRHMAHSAMTDPRYSTTRDILMSATPETLGSHTRAVTGDFERPKFINDRRAAVQRAFNSYQPPQKTAALGGTTTDAATGGPPSFTQAMAKVIGPGAPPPANPDVGTQISALTGGNQPAPSAPVRTAQAAGGAPVPSGGLLAPQRGTFIDPSFIQPRVHISDRQIRNLRFYHSMGDIDPKQMEEWEKMYFDQNKPIEVTTPLGQVIIDPRNPANQVRYPKIEEKPIKPEAGVEIPNYVTPTEQGYVRVPMGSAAAIQGGAQPGTGGAPASGQGFPMTGNVQDIVDWGRANKVKTTTATEQAKGQVQQYQKDYADIQQKSLKAQDEMPQLGVMAKLLEDPSFYSGIGHNQVLDFKRILAATGIDPKAAASMEAFNKLASSTAIQNLGLLKGLGQIRVAEINLINRANVNSENTPPANRAVLDIYRRINQRAMDVGAEARAYQQKHNGALDRGWDEHVANYLEEHPLFNEGEIKNYNKLFDAKAGEKAKPIRRYNKETGGFDEVE